MSKCLVCGLKLRKNGKFCMKHWHNYKKIYSMINAGIDQVNREYHKKQLQQIVICSDNEDEVI